MTTLATDVNGDNTVDGADFDQMAGHWGQTTWNQATWTHASGDVNRDGIVDGLDSGYMFGEWGATDLAEDQLFLWVIGYTELYTGRDFDAEVWLQYNRARY